MQPIDATRRKRLAQLISEAGSQAALSEKIGKAPAQISQWLNASVNSATGKPRVMSNAVAREVEKKLGLPEGWMDQAETVGVPTALGTHPADIPLSGYKTQVETSDIVIPQYDTGGAMGGGRLLLAEQPGLIKSWHVDHEWVRLNVKHYSSLSNLCIVTGFGNSMKPMFNPGDPLLIDKGINHVDHDGIFFFRVGEHGFIKQIQRIPDPMTGDMVFRAKSMNDAQYDPFDIHPSNPQFAVLGKVLTVWRSEQY